MASTKSIPTVFLALFSLFVGVISTPDFAQAEETDWAAKQGVDDQGDNIESALNFWEKRLVQEGLIVLGLYNGLADGNFGKGTRSAIAKYQTQKGRPATGELTAADAVMLGASAVTIKEKIGWQALTSKSGISMSYPAAVLTERTALDAETEALKARDRTYILSVWRKINVDAGALDYAFRTYSERAGAQITYQLRRPNYFIVSGNEKGFVFYARAELRGNEVRGYSLIWQDGSDAQLYQNVSVLMSSSFYPFGGDPAQGKATYPTLEELAKAAVEQSTNNDAARTGNSQPSQSSARDSGSAENGVTEQNEGALPPPQDGSLVTSDGKGLRFVFHYVKPKDPKLQYAYQWAVDTHLFSTNPEIAAVDGSFALPRQLNYVTAQCGEINAFYAKKLSAIVLCYEMIDDLRQMAETLSKGISDPKAFTTEFVRDTLRFILMHETGHALIDMLDLPTVGREEDAVDQLAAITLVKLTGPNESKNDKARVLQLAATWFKVNSVNRSPGMAAFADEHSLDAQRYYNILCIAYDLDAAQYRGVVNQGLLPQARADRCVDEAAKIGDSWLRLLLPHEAVRYKAKSQASAGIGRGATPPPQQQKNPLEWDRKSNPFGN